MEVAIPCKIFSMCEDVDRGGHWVFLDFNTTEDPAEWSRDEKCFCVSPQDLTSLIPFYSESVELVVSDEVDVRKPEDPGNIPVRVWKTHALLESLEGGTVSLLVNQGPGTENSPNNALSFEVPTRYILLFFAKRISLNLVMYFRLLPPPDPRKRKR